MPGLGLPILHVLHDITVVGDDELLCNTACTRLRNRAQELADSHDVPWDAPLLFWDTESVAYIDGSGVSQQHCSLVQVMAASDGGSSVASLFGLVAVNEFQQSACRVILTP